MFNFWWSAEQSEQKMLTEMQKNEKGPLSHQKIKCLFLDYFQLLMIGRAIWAKNIDQNAKKWKRSPKSLKNKMFVFGLHSTSDDWLSNLSDEHWPKCKKNEKGPLSHQKIKCSFSDGLPEDCQKTAKRPAEDKQKTTRSPTALQELYIKLVLIW